MYESLFPSSVQLSNETLTTACKYIQTCQATLGSTDIWRPLHSLFLLSEDATTQGGITNTSTLPPRSVFIISDGHMTEEAPTLTAITKGAKSTRVFTFGVR